MNQLCATMRAWRRCWCASQCGGRLPSLLIPGHWNYLSRRGKSMHKHLIVAASVLALVATNAPALAKWGCGAQGKGAQCDKENNPK
jgi:hypothetical protein